MISHQTRISTVLIAAGALIPGVALSQGIGQTPSDIGDFYSLILALLGAAIPVIVGLAVLVFLWGVVSYVAAGGDERARTDAVQYIFWGIIGLFVMVSVWGLVAILSNTFGFPLGVPLAPTSASPNINY
jgi:hypothetical protein